MDYAKIINHVIDTARKEFEQLYTEEEKDYLENYPLNKFYEGYQNKYQYLIHKFIEKNAYLYLIDYYNENKCSYETRLNIFKWMYKAPYKFVLFDDNNSVVPKEFNDDEFFKKMLFDKNFQLICNVLKTSENSEELFFDVTNDIEYQNLFNYDLKKLIACYSEQGIIDFNIYNKMFDDLCIKDRYGYCMDEFLNNECKVINSINLRSLIKNIYLYAGVLVDCDVKTERSKVFYNALTSGRIQIIDTSDVDLLMLNIKYFKEDQKILSKELRDELINNKRN